MNKHLEFWKNVSVKGFVMAGFTFFSICATMGFGSAFEPSLVAGGGYIFVEAMRYYNIQSGKKASNITYSFLI
jgi:hypothetical protein